jgi:non-specific serine/threonine protein kinase
MAPSLTLHLFGPMQARVNGEPLPAMRSRKARWLLALLALQEGQAVNREWVAGTLWPDASLPIALANLRPVVSDLRRALGSHGERLQTLGRKMLSLDLAGAEVDVALFDAALAEGRLEDAVNLYRGELLEDCREPWVTQAREFWERTCLETLDRLAESAKGADALAFRRRAVEIAPLHDLPRRALMEALAQSGDVNAALETYREFAEALRGETGGLPDATTTDLYHRLRTDARPRTERTAIPGYLPHPLSGLVGREEERKDIISRLMRSRLVTLTGFGGIGKTRLAREVGADLAAEIPDGVWFVALDSLTEERLLTSQVANVLGLQEANERPHLDQLVDHLREKHALIVLDNCEHLIDACARLCDTLLRECGGLRVLATSREPLGITGEWVWHTTPLSVPDTAHLPPHPATRLRVVASYESVQLFLQRAQATDDTFDLTAENAEDVATICRRLEGIPLAVELAAARVKAMTIGQIRQRLEDPLAFLTHAGRSSVPRQQTLRTTLDWSYGLLGDDARRLLRRIAFFVGGWTLETAEAVCGGDGIEQDGVATLLASLVDKSIVLFERNSCGGRYRLLEPVRQYALSLAADEGPILRERFVSHFCAFSQDVEVGVRGPHQAVWLERLRIEDGNVRQATRWAEETPELAHYILRFAAAHGLAAFMAGRYREGSRILKRGLELAPTENSAERAKALSFASALAQGEGDFTLSLTFLEDALKTSEALGDREGIAIAKRTIGDAYLGNGRRRIAQRYFEEAYHLHREVGALRGAAICAVQLGTCLATDGNIEDAERWAEEGKAYFVASNEPIGVAWALTSLGNIYLDNNLPEKARPFYEEELMLLLEHGPHRMIYTCDNLAKVCAALDDPEGAIEYLERGMATARELEDQRAQAILSTSRGEIAVDRGDFHAARGYAMEALQHFRHREAPFQIMFVLRVLASAAIGLGKVGEGVRLLAGTRAVQCQSEIDVVPDENLRLTNLEAKARALLPPKEFEAAWQEGWEAGTVSAYDLALRAGAPAGPMTNQRS